MRQSPSVESLGLEGVHSVGRVLGSPASTILPTGPPSPAPLTTPRGSSSFAGLESSPPSHSFSDQQTLGQAVFGKVPETYNSLRAGDRIQVVGLKTRLELNGLVGILTGFDREEGRWKVRMEDNTGKLFRPQNLELAGFTSPAGVVLGEQPSHVSLATPATAGEYSTAWTQPTSQFQFPSGAPAGSCGSPIQVVDGSLPLIELPAVDVQRQTHASAAIVSPTPASAVSWSVTPSSATLVNAQQAPMMFPYSPSVFAGSSAPPSVRSGVQSSMMPTSPLSSMDGPTSLALDSHSRTPSPMTIPSAVHGITSIIVEDAPATPFGSQHQAAMSSSPHTPYCDLMSPSLDPQRQVIQHSQWIGPREEVEALSFAGSPTPAAVASPFPYPTTPAASFDEQTVANAIANQLPLGPRVCLLGGAGERDQDADICAHALASLMSAALAGRIVVLTGGGGGAQEVFARGLGNFPALVHLLPSGETSGYGVGVTGGSVGTDLPCGATPAECSAVLGQLGDIYLILGTGSSVAAEARAAFARGALVLPLLSSGAAATMPDFPPGALQRPASVPEILWQRLQGRESPDVIASAVVAIVSSHLAMSAPDVVDGLHEQVQLELPTDVDLDSISMSPAQHSGTVLVGPVAHVVSSGACLCESFETAEEFELSFDLTPGEVGAEWGNLLRFASTQSDASGFGDFMPAFFFHPNSARLYVVMGRPGSHDSHCSALSTLPTGVTSRIIARLAGNSFRIFADGSEVCSMPGYRAAKYPAMSAVKVWASDDFHPTANASIANLVYTRLEAETMPLLSSPQSATPQSFSLATPQSAAITREYVSPAPSPSSVGNYSTLEMEARHAEELSALNDELARVRHELAQERTAVATLQSERAAAEAAAAELTQERNAALALHSERAAAEAAAAEQRLLGEESRERLLHAEIEEMRNAVASQEPTGVPQVASSCASPASPQVVTETAPAAEESADIHLQVPAEVLAEVSPPTPIQTISSVDGPAMPPFSLELCGANLTLSEDGYTAARTRGSRQSVVLVNAPLARRAEGFYFEVRICQTTEGWVGGLGIGVTHTCPGDLQTVPDKAWRIPSTFIVGYWGTVFLNGKERLARWRPDSLQAGTNVGLLITGDGRNDLLVFVNGTPAIHIDGAALKAAGLRPAPLYPVVDVFASTTSVTLLPQAGPPPPPWHLQPSSLRTPEMACR